MANISYFYLDKCYEKTYHTGSQMMARIEQQNLESIRGIVFIGNKSEIVSISDTFPASKIHILSNLLESDLCYDGIHTYLFLKNTFGLDVPEISDTEKELLLCSEEVKRMGKNKEKMFGFKVLSMMS